MTPPMIWTALCGVACLGMDLVGWQFGLSGLRNVIVGLAVAFAFAWVIAIIADLDRAREGRLRVNLRPRIELHESLGTGPD